MSTRRWMGRFVLGALAVVAIELGARYEHVRPDHLRLSLVVAVVVAVVGLMLDAALMGSADWEVSSRTTIQPPGQDSGLSLYVRMMESHLSSRVPDPVLQSRLRRLVDDRLRRRGLRPQDPEARSLVGPDLAAALEGPPRKLSKAELAVFVHRIEEL